MAIRTPVIPDEIVVHLGPPNEEARNITVPFKEYIKNVASSELYPTWPADAIKANVLAQVSFALNRIYNEWYRSQGYNFDITSSPQYDQAFTEDIQFFEIMTKIVDDIFNNYIVNNGQVQPLFATYCDGKNVTCEGLSQWGSVDLARRGLSPIEILKYYYGDDIKIIYNAPVEANIQTYPGFPVRLGNSGDFVRLLKTQLNRIGQNYPAIPIIIDDSVFFTVETENAVRKFQEIFDLDVTGIVDKATWYKIKYLYNAVKKLSDLYSEGISIDEAQLIFDKQVDLGDEGYYIRTLNYFLNVISYFDQSIPFLELEGEVFTENTQEAVIAFQKKYGLPATGVVDARTWASIRGAYAQTLATIPREYMIYIDEFFPGLFLSKGMTGNNIIKLQNFLYTICENTHEIPGVRVNGVFDNLTEQSIKSIQRRVNAEPTGVVGPALWYYIVEWAKNASI
ncbi:MAG: peptidoglycan-binding protein [Methanobrevibacter sp.]|uniref:peptidoglycan-binding protein n=1 Tax=Methanobrevibacter sp. TaxID=66852 RepID=UPI001B12CB99|nr:peptidoglycan-binding protein [Methanobrevibacter sp.]MBO5150754.1 peptidoglycan-binding protein [Methanobrevibacter sp.]